MKSLDQALDEEPGSLLARSLDGTVPQAFPIASTPNDGSVEGEPAYVLTLPPRDVVHSHSSTRLS